MPIVDLSALLGPVDRAELSALHHGEPAVLEAPRPGSPDEARRVATVLREAPTVTVLRDEPDVADPLLVAAADVCLTDDADPPRPWVAGPVDVVVDAVRRQPGAAVALVVLLRSTDGAEVWPAIAAEAATYSMLLASDAHRDWLAGRPAPRARVADDPVRTRRDGDAVWVTLARPEARNAVDRHLRDALVAALDLPWADRSIATVHLTGEGPDLCAGGDLTEFGTTSDPATAFATRLGVHPGWSAHRVAGRLIAHLHGHCIGAGIEVPAFAGHVVAHGEVQVALPELSMGLVPGAGGTVSIPRRIGRQRTAWLALTGAPIDTPTAHRWGLVDEVRDDRGPPAPG